MKSPEAHVVRALKRHLMSHGIGGIVPSRILVDADPSYINSSCARELEPIARVDVGGGRPDLLCSTAREGGALVTAFEVKASSRDWLQGIGQARRYRAGAHHSYLAVPGVGEDISRDANVIAKETGVGLLVLEKDTWRQMLPPADPTPLPWTLGATAAALEGVGVARQLQLNHPLNYLVVPVLAAGLPMGGDLFAELAARWPDLGSDGTRKHAINGARTLGLLDEQLCLTLEGATVAELMLAVGFAPETRPMKRGRLATLAPSLAAVARFVLLQQGAVRLIMRTLRSAGGSMCLPELAVAATRIDPPLGGALFLTDPSREPRPDLPGTAYNSTTVFKLKQNLWHAGLLTTKCHSTAGGRAVAYTPSKDFWAIDPGLGSERFRVKGVL